MEFGNPWRPLGHLKDRIRSIICPQIKFIFYIHLVSTRMFLSLSRSLLLTLLVTHALNLSLTHSIIHSLNHSLAHSLSLCLSHLHSLNHQFIHSLTHSPNLTLFSFIIFHPKRTAKNKLLYD